MATKQMYLSLAKLIKLLLEPLYSRLAVTRVRICGVCGPLGLSNQHNGRARTPVAPTKGKNYSLLTAQLYWQGLSIGAMGLLPTLTLLRCKGRGFFSLTKRNLSAEAHVYVMLKKLPA
jgi:hypothetical protein